MLLNQLLYHLLWARGSRLPPWYAQAPWEKKSSVQFCESYRFSLKREHVYQMVKLTMEPLTK